MAQKKYILTISLLASNRKDTLPKTLESLKPILDKVSSELIVVDTGCDEELLEIVRKYTGKIIKFEWCKDFAKARNAGLEKAQGEWFMFIDDDEWFEEAEDIITFFNSGEHKNYGAGRYLVRNYGNMEGTEWTDAVVGRMFRLFEGTKFIDAVHERMINTAGPVKNFTCYAHHYGYVYKNEEEKKKHLERNISLLEGQIKREPNSARHFAHLGQEYCTAKNYVKVVEVCESGIAQMDRKSSENLRDYGALCTMIVWSLINQHRYEEAYNEAKKYYDEGICNDLSKCLLCEFLALTKCAVDEYDEALNYVDEYMKYVEYFAKHTDEKYAQSTIMIMKADVEENILRTATVGLEAAIAKKDETLVEKYINYINFSEPVPFIQPIKCMANIVELMVNTTRIAWCASIVDEVLKNGQHGANLIAQMMEVEKLEGGDKWKFYKLADIMALSRTNRGYVQYMKIICARNDIYPERLNILYEEAFKTITDIVNVDNKFFMIAIDKVINIDKMIQNHPMDKWTVAVDEWMVNIKVAKLIEKKQILDQLIRPNTIHMIYFEAAMAEALLLRKRLDNVTADGLRDEMIRFYETAMTYYRMIYREEIFEKYPSVLPTRCQVALLMKKLCACAAGDGEEIVDDILKLMPRLEKVMSKYKELAQF